MLKIRTYVRKPVSPLELAGALGEAESISSSSGLGGHPGAEAEAEAEARLARLPKPSIRTYILDPLSFIQRPRNESALAQDERNVVGELLPHPGRQVVPTDFACERVCLVD